jgi:hypothetical protein
MTNPVSRQALRMFLGYAPTYLATSAYAADVQDGGAGAASVRACGLPAIEAIASVLEAGRIAGPGVEIML